MAQELLGTKRLVVGAHYGTADFIVQRVTAVIMAVYTIILGLGLLFTPELTFESWRHLFTFTCFQLPLGQLLATLAFLSVAWHAWVGVRDIWMDYVRSAGLRLFLQALTLLWLVGSVIFLQNSLESISRGSCQNYFTAPPV